MPSSIATANRANSEFQIVSAAHAIQVSDQIHLTGDVILARPFKRRFDGMSQDREHVGVDRSWLVTHKKWLGAQEVRDRIGVDLEGLIDVVFGF